MSLFNWAELIHLAEVLGEEAKAEKSEGKRRTAISRAYYGTYNQALALAKRKLQMQQRRDESVHTQLWSFLCGTTGTHAPRLGAKGRELHKLRLAADYEGQVTVTDNLVKQSLDIAKLAGQLMSEVDKAP